MVQLSLCQLWDFFLKFMGCCTREQRQLLEQKFCLLLKQDLMTLPELIVVKIVDYLDISTLLNLRLVCQSWNKNLTSMSLLWQSKCQRLPVRFDRSCIMSDADDFDFFMQSQRVLQMMATGTAFKVTCETIWNPDEASTSLTSLRVGHLLAYICSNNVIVIGSADRHNHLTAVDARTKCILWQSRDSVPSCLYASADLVLTGNHFGQIRALTLEGTFQYKLQCCVNSVTALDVHPSGHFFIIGACKGTLHLVDKELEVCRVCLQTDTLPESLFIRRVFFLPDSSLSPGQLAVCVCTDRWRSVAVISKTGCVLHQENYTFKSSVFSICRSSSEPHVLFITTEHSVLPAAERTFETHIIQVSSSGVSSKVLQAEISSSQPASSLYHSDVHNVLLLAAGRELSIAAIMDSIVVFRISCGTILSTCAHFLEGISVTRLLRNQESGRVLAVNVAWLDRPSPSSMQGDVPLVLFSTRDQVNFRPMIKSLFWSPALWDRLKGGGQCGSVHPEDKTDCECDEMSCR